MSEWNMIGHGWAVRRLKRELDSGQLAQSHLFVGPPYVGKAALAKALAREILSLNAVDPLRAQRLVDQLKHPDLSWIGLGEGESSVHIVAIRTLIHTLTLAPVEGRYRVAVIDDAHLATDESQNAILKTLEEPNPSTVLILIAWNTDALLPTIVSRCQVLYLRPVSTQVLQEGLVQRGVDPSQADLITRLAYGRPGWALRVVAEPELLERRTQRLVDLEALLSANKTQRLRYSEALARSGSEMVQETLQQWLLYWLDVVRIASSTTLHTMATKDDARVPALHNSDRTESIREVAAKLTVCKAVDMLRTITDTYSFLQQNARPQLVLDALLLKMPAL